jgi:lipid-binding SYLF domain-containing protein
MLRSFLSFLLLIAVALVALPGALRAADPEQTVRLANQTLHEIMTIPASQIPGSLLRDAQGVAIIPNVIKVGFIAGFRRGHGVVMVRGADGNWTMPQFVVLTGGSVGWQAGVQGTDVVLVFMTPKSVQGLMSGKFTIGADASAAAGPVGRNASAATDARLQAEILSYSRSRGLFAGVSLDGSAIEVDPNAYAAYYGGGVTPLRVPESGVRLVQELTQLSSGAVLAPMASPAPVAAPAGAARTRQTLSESTTKLYALLDEQWRQYLALPREALEGANPPSHESLQTTLNHFEEVATDPRYRTLAARPEFKAAYDALKAYANELTAVPGQQLSLPPPPAGSAAQGVTPASAVGVPTPAR